MTRTRHAHAIIPSPAGVEPVAGEPVALRTGDPLRYRDPRLASLAARWADDLALCTGIGLHPVQDGTGGGGVEIHLVQDASVLPAPVDTHGISPSGGDPSDERYRLTVGARGVRVVAAAPEGVFRALSTLAQMIGAAAAAAGTDAAAVGLEPVEVHDAPRYAWRGLSLDVVRRFMPPAEVRDVIDELARFKFNVLHLHLTDNQGWRLEIPGLPKLTEIGGRGAVGDRPGGYYTRQEYAELVRYAAERFVTVVPEVDMPGHSAAAFAAYPGRLSSADTPIVGQPPMTLDPDDAQTMEFVRTVVESVAGATPGPHIHIGGDEAFGMDEEAYGRFVRQADAMARNAGKSPVAWQEASRGGVGAGGIVQYWMTGDPDAGMLDNAAEHGFDIPPEMLDQIRAGLAHARGDLPRALDAGARILVTPTDHVYLDQPHAEPGPEAQEQRRKTVGLQLYKGLTLEEVQGWDPLALAPELTSEAQIAGVEAALWCETVETFADAQFLLQPRLACVAERAWSPRSVGDWGEFSRRLAERAPTWRRLGWDFFRANSVRWS
ncbi:family 20 glycosylhydrolase [Tomitella gaofuii]|uniref:family 20 glycosylhydrolase n=1 Tax=Tomitella gaofuii TaxID=2760083 RepID=UPI0015FBE16F|nr:family 20 glycosylhydrolase [Tomitella gaofuii]